jgi:hypothetical protein
MIDASSSFVILSEAKDLLFVIALMIIGRERSASAKCQVLNANC